MITPVWIVGFTGHRDVTNPSAVSAALTEALQKLKQQAEEQQGRLEFYGSAAYGSDTLAAEAAEALGIPVHLVLPMPEDEFKNDFYSDAARKTFLQNDWDKAKALIDRARANHNDGTLRLSRGSHLRDECYYEAGLQILDTCDVLLAVYDEGHADHIRQTRLQPSHEHDFLGGTFDMVEQAKDIDVPTIKIEAKTGRLLLPTNEFPPLSPHGMSVIKPLLAHAPKSFRIQKPTDLLEGLDVIANSKAKWFRASSTASILFHGIAALIAAIALLFDVVNDTSTLVWLAAIEFVLVFTAWLLTFTNKKWKTHEHWLRSRFATEQVRSILPAIGFLDPLLPGVGRHRPHWRRFAMSAALLIRRLNTPLPKWEQRQKTYLKDRLSDQINHYSERLELAKKQYGPTATVGKWAELLAPWFVGAALLVKLAHYLEHLEHSGHHLAPWLHSALTAPAIHPLLAEGLWQTIAFRLLPVLLPLIAGVAHSLRSALDSSRRVHSYPRIIEQLKRIRGGFLTLQTEAAVRRTVVMTEEILLDELIEWHLAEQQNGGH